MLHCTDALQQPSSIRHTSYAFQGPEGRRHALGEHYGSSNLADSGRLASRESRVVDFDQLSKADGGRIPFLIHSTSIGAHYAHRFPVLLGPPRLCREILGVSGRESNPVTPSSMISAKAPIREANTGRP